VNTHTSPDLVEVGVEIAFARLLVAGVASRLTRDGNLNAEVRPSIRLFEGIARHRVSWIREVEDREGIAAAPGTTVVDAIQW
jgi:hypothetical protein